MEARDEKQAMREQDGLSPHTLSWSIRETPCAGHASGAAKLSWRGLGQPGEKGERQVSGVERTEVLRLGLLTLAMTTPAQRALARPALWGRQGVALTGKRQLWASSPGRPSSREHVLRETSAVLPLEGGCSHSCSHRCSSALTHAHGDSHILLAPPTPALKLCMPSEELGASGTELHGRGTSGLAG